MNLADLREALHKIKADPEWVMLWEHLVEARNGCLQRFLGVKNWEEFVELRGEINALNDFIEFGDLMLDRLEEAETENENARAESRRREA